MVVVVVVFFMAFALPSNSPQREVVVAIVCMFYAVNSRAFLSPGPGAVMTYE